MLIMSDSEKWQDYFKGKKVTQMSLGLLGRGVGDARFLAESGVDLIVTDLKTEGELAESVTALKDFPNITFHLGGHDLADFRDRDFIVKGAGIPLDSLYIEEARKNNVPIEMSTSLFAKLTEATIVGVTGTRGKSTVTHLLFDILKNGYKGGQVFLGGNVRGLSTLPLLREAKRGDIVVMELDSWQLQGFGEAKISPHVSVFTTFLPDHLNYYKGSMDAYLDDKANIFKFQKPGDSLVLGSQCAGLVREKYPYIQSHTSIVGQGALSPDWNIQIPGEHNRYNIALAVEAARTLGVAEDSIKKTVEEFKGVPGRLEFLREVNGMKVYNDTTATTPDATIVALKALGEESATANAAAGKFNSRNIVLIMGGADKNLDMSKLVEILPHFCKTIVLLPGTGTERIMDDFETFEMPIVKTLSMKEAVMVAFKEAAAGDVVLLSPAFASFGLFKNEFDRGEQFNTLIKNL